MKAAAVVLTAFLCAGAYAENVQKNPLGTVFELITSLEAKIVKEGEAEAAAFKEFFNWCDSSSQQLNFEIKTAKKSSEKLTAQIDELSSSITVSDSKISDLSGSIATSDAELKEATAIREKEAADFAASESELVATVDTLDRALSIISTEMSKNPASLAQIDTSSMSSIVQSLTAVVDAAGLSGNDQQKLVALVQSHQADQDGEMGAPSVASYTSHSSGIVDVLEDLKEKAETELAEARKAESNTKHQFAMMKQSLEDQMADETKDMKAEQTAKAASEQEKATAEGDLSVAQKDLKTAEEGLATSNSDCMTTAADHEATVAARDAELKVIKEAESILKESTSGAEGQTYSFVQVAAASKMKTRADLANNEVLTAVKKLARDHHSAALAQLASRIGVVLRYGSKNGADPFAKIKGLISAMIEKLIKEADAEASEKAYCDEQIAKTEAKKAELEGVIAKLMSKIDRAAAKSTALKGEVTELEAELAALAKMQADMDKIRSEESANFQVAKAELTQGLTGVRKALELLRGYYGSAAALVQNDAQFNAFLQQPAAPEQHAKAGGAGGSIINILEVCESDFATNLAKEESEESDSAESYEKTTQENKITKTTKMQDVKYKTAEYTSLDKEISELSGDKDTTSTELAAVMEYYGKIKERCIAKPETYEERAARRQAEISGLKEALSILENEAALIQSGKRVGRGRRSSHFMAAF